MSQDKKNCKFSIYVAAPSIFAQKEKGKRVRRKLPFDEISYTGHAFIGLTDENGVEKKIGFYPRFFLLGANSVPREDVIKTPKDLFKHVKGVFKDETTSRYDYVINYDISKEQYKQAVNYIDDWEKTGKKYAIFVNNCVSFAFKTASSIVLKPPKQLLFHLPTPHGAIASLAIKKKLDETKMFSAKIAKKISKYFAGAGQVIHKKRAKRRAAMRAAIGIRKNIVNQGR